MSIQAEEKLDELGRLFERAEEMLTELRTDNERLKGELALAQHTMVKDNRRCAEELENLQRDLAQAHITIEEQAKRLPGRSRP
jgi:hypothetical protein